MPVVISFLPLLLTLLASSAGKGVDSRLAVNASPTTPSRACCLLHASRAPISEQTMDI